MRRQAALFLLALTPALARGQAPDTLPGEFDTGKMWTFEYAPLDYFSETYGFTADQSWLDRIRMSVLRVPGCSGSFVSPNGLVATNHHCIRGTLASIQREGESLLDDGFWAASLDEERRIPNYYVDRLIAVHDVSDRMFAALDTATTDESRDAARRVAITTIQNDLITREMGGDDLRVEVIGLYHGGRYSAYVFRRYDDVRMVGAVELQAGFFGGDPDNFTYPRYALDFAFLRVYDDNGEPFEPGQYLGWGSDGVDADDVVFVVGNPGPTSRLQTIAQLEYTRDVQGPAIVAAYESRLDAMQAFYEANRELGDEMDIRNQMFGLSNSLKAWAGRVDALRDDMILARKRVFERAFRDSIRSDDELRERYGAVVDSIARLQQQKRALGDRYAAFLMLNSGLAGSRTLQRAIAAQQLAEARNAGVSADSLATLRDRVLAIGDRPAALELALLAEQLGDFRTYLGDRPELTLVPRSTNDEANARELLARTIFADSARTAAALAAGDPPANDPALRLVAQLLPLQRTYATESNRIATTERALAERLGRARFEVYGNSIAPDATFSPRITDGVVRGYPANGTMMPPYTTFYGMYERHYAHAPSVDWALPGGFLPIPGDLDLGTPLNFVSTADTYGGNSGSPAITPDLDLVGLNFDRNVEGLSRDFIYLPDRGRNVMVDSRAILEALDDIYDADRIVAELLTGRLNVPAQEAERLRQ